MGRWRKKRPESGSLWECNRSRSTSRIEEILSAAHKGFSQKVETAMEMDLQLHRLLAPIVEVEIKSS